MSEDKGLTLFAQNSCNCERPMSMERLSDLEVQDRPEVSEMLNVHTVWRSNSSTAKMMIMSFPCCVLKVVEQELV